MLDSHVVLEIPNNQAHRRPTEEKVQYLDCLFLFSAVASRLISKLHKHKARAVKSEIQEKFENAFSRLESAYATKLDWAPYVDTMTKLVLSYPTIHYLLHALLCRISPKVIVEVVHYSWSIMLINQVAKELKIPTVELQHGIIGAEHVAYNYASGTHVRQFPDYLFLFSDYWRDSMRIPILPNRVISVGFPYYEQQVAQYKQERIAKDTTRKTVLILSQLTVGQTMATLAIDLADRLSSEAFRILYKLHPAEYNIWRKRYPQLENSSIIVIDKQEKDIYSCFAESDIQVGAYSTAIYEGFGFGLATYILRTDAFDRVEDLCAKGYAIAFSSAEELAVLLKNETHAATVNAKFFWQDNALTNMWEAIQKIMI
jgi:hypothetical protein